MKTIKTTMSFCDCGCPNCDYSFYNCSAETKCPYCEEILYYDFEPIKEKQNIVCDNCNKKYSVIVSLDILNRRNEVLDKLEKLISKSK